MASEFDIQLKKKKKSFIENIKNLFEDKKKRYLYMCIALLPFLIAIGIFTFIAIKDAKGLLELATGTEEVKDEYKVPQMGYVLRDNATEYQFNSFQELRTAVEDDATDDATIAGLVCKNFVIDFYTWTNKKGQYDVGGMYYLYDGEFVDGDKTKENFYANARNGFYKYLSTYIKEYGASNLLEVDNANVVSSTKTNNCVINEHVANKQDENGEWYDYREDHEYEAYKVTCSWTYKQNNKFSTDKFANKMNFLVIKTDEAFRIVAANEREINDREIQETNKEISSESVITED